MGEEIQQPKKSNTLFYCLLFGCLFLLLGGIGATVVLVVAAGAAAQALAEYAPVDDPVQVQSRLNAILPSSLPAGYHGVAMKLPMGYEFVMVAPQNQPQNGAPGVFMVLCKFPPGQQADEVKKEIKKALQKHREANGQGQLKVESDGTDGVVKQEITIRGEAVGLEQTVGNTDDGKRLKQLFLAIPRTKGSQDVVFLMAVGEEQAFDEAAFKSYVDSIR